MWLLAILVLFLGLTWLGRQVRLGRWPSGPWIKQFRTVRSVFAMGCVAVGLLMVARGLWPEGLGALVLAAVLSGTVRYGASREAKPQAAATYSVEEIKAYRTLGLAVGADRKAIKDAWKKLMKAAHPDQGGAEDRAKALNAARDVLLRRAR